MGCLKACWLLQELGNCTIYHLFAVRALQHLATLGGDDIWYYSRAVAVAVAFPVAVTLAFPPIAITCVITRRRYP